MPGSGVGTCWLAILGNTFGLVRDIARAALPAEVKDRPLAEVLDDDSISLAAKRKLLDADFSFGRFGQNGGVGGVVEMSSLPWRKGVALATLLLFASAIATFYIAGITLLSSLLPDVSVPAEHLPPVPTDLIPATTAYGLAAAGLVPHGTLMVRRQLLPPPPPPRTSPAMAGVLTRARASGSRRTAGCTARAGRP